MVINSAVKEIRQYHVVILDEIHRYASDVFSLIFKNVGYKYILGLTATFERLDGKEILLQKYAPVIDKITLEDSLINGWVSPYIEYEVLINVDDIAQYEEMNREFTEHFEFFNYDFGLAMSMVTKDGWKNKIKYRDELYKGNDENMKKQVMQSINYHAAQFIKTMTARKSFIYNHPKKLEIARRIMEAKSGSKIITFSANVNMAEAIEGGQNVYTGQTSKKKGRVMLEDFISGQIKTLHSCKKLDEGFDCPDASVAIILGFDSSETKSTQRRGRVVRKFEDKVAEIFYIVLNNTQETKWFAECHKKTDNYLTIDEKGLEQVLRGEVPDVAKHKPRELVFRW
jgi:superfamily II DNA or RNA helicase